MAQCAVRSGVNGYCGLPIVRGDTGNYGEWGMVEGEFKNIMERMVGIHQLCTASFSLDGIDGDGGIWDRDGRKK